MIWTTWRQHRAELGVGALILLALAAAMTVVGTTARDRARVLGLPACLKSHAECGQALNALHRDFHSIPPFTAALVAIPLLAGMFWAAPLVSREYQAGTHRLAWTQSVSPLRWITTKIALLFGITAAAALALGLLATWTLDPLTPAFGGRYNSTWYDVEGIVPIACMLFALAVGIAASALIRRTIPAMALTLVAYAAARIPIHFFRAHFAPLATRTVSVPLSTLVQDLQGSPQGYAKTTAPGDWTQHITVTDSTGHALATNNGNLSVVQHYCPTLHPTRTTNGGIHLDSGACQSVLNSVSIRVKISYQTASHFWLIQTVESLIFLGLATVFAAAAVLAVTHRRPS